MVARALAGAVLSGGLALGLWLPASAGEAAATRPARRAYSFLGLQLTLPAGWTVHYFSPCQGAEDSLYVGRRTSSTSCGGGGLNRPSVDAEPVATPSSLANAVTSWRVVHGLWAGMDAYRPASDPSVSWYVPSAGAALAADGTRGLAVLRSLRPATARAHPAPGLVTGSEEASGSTPASPLPAECPVRLTPPHGGARTVEPTYGSFDAQVPAGTYLARTGSGADRTTEPVTVASGGSAKVTLACPGT